MIGKDVPQGLKPSLVQDIVARLKAVPFVQSRAHGLESFPLRGGPQEARHGLV